VFFLKRFVAEINFGEEKFINIENFKVTYGKGFTLLLTYIK